MNLRALGPLLFPLLLAACTTATPPVIRPPVATVDDDHRLVSREEFQASSWTPLPAEVSWRALPNGASVTLADGRDVQLTIVTPSVVRWWVPSVPGQVHHSVAAVDPAEPVPVVVSESQGTLLLKSAGVSVRWALGDLSWSLARGDTVILHTSGGPRVAGHRLVQGFQSADAVAWLGPGLMGDSTSTKVWVGSKKDDGTGPFAVAAVLGVGGTQPFEAVLDTGYQAYVRKTADETSLGALNGGLDLLVATAPEPSGVVGALTSLTGRSLVPPLWAHGTVLGLPPDNPGTFVRQAKLAVQAAAGPRAVRPGFQSVVTVPGGVLPDLTDPPTAASWLGRPGWTALAPATGVEFSSGPDRLDWSTTFVDGGKNTPLAAMNNRLSTVAAQVVTAATAAQAPGARPLVLADSASLSTVRSALPEVRVSPGDDALPSALAWGFAGMGTPAVRLDVTALAQAESRESGFQDLVAWILVPVLTLDAGPDPTGWWASLGADGQKRLKTILDRRSQFKPLLSQLTRESATTGRPAWVPVWFDGPRDPKALAQRDEFLLGRDLLVAPASGGAKSRTVYLPGPGVWFDFWTGEEFGGGQSYDVEVQPDRPLLFARGGAFVPVREPETYDGRDIYNPLTIHVFPGGMGQGTYYLDDGLTTAWKTGGAWETRLTYRYAQREMTIEHEVVTTTGQLRPDPYVLYRLHNVFRPKQVAIDGKPIPLFGDSWGITDTDRSAAWYEGDHTLLLKTFHPERDQTIQISF